MRLLLGVLLGMAVMAVDAGAYRTETAPTISEWNTNTFTQLNNFLSQLSNVQNGRYQLDALVTTPNGSRNGEKGEMVYAVFGGSEYLCVNTDGVTTWKCATLL